MHEIGKAMVSFGLLLVFLGALVMLAARFGLPLGRLPAIFHTEGRIFRFIFRWERRF